MCTLCNVTQTFDPARHVSGDNATITEGRDAVSGTGTNYSISVGDVFSGTIASGDTSDWVAIRLEAGHRYRFDLRGSDSGNGTLSDPFLYLYNSSGTEIASNDDGGSGSDSRLVFTASTTGTYYLGADAYRTATGTYQLSSSEVEPSRPGSIDQLARYLTNGYWEGTSRAARSWDMSSDNQLTVNLTGLTTAGQQLARWALQAWEMVANIDFVESTSSNANITLDDNQPKAFSSSTVSGNTIISSHVNVSTNWLRASGTTIDSYSFQTYVHEIGHAIGLGHQGGYNGNASYGTDETFSNDSWQMSIMSYFDQNENTSVNASYARLMTTMMSDIVAIQNLYGAAGGSSATAGNTTWGMNSNLGNYLDQVFRGMSTNSAINGVYTNRQSVAFTIYDRSGVDTINLSFSSNSDRIDLRAGMFSDIGGLTGNLGIARGTVIENLESGSGNDSITGNSVNNYIDGNAGNDVIYGNDGADTIFGGTGDDVIYGGTQFDHLIGDAGNDTINGGFGADITWLGIGNDVYTDTSQSGFAGRDTVFGETGNDRIDGGGGDDRLLGGDGNDTLIGGTGNDVLDGGNQFDWLDGGAGNDTITGGFGRDTAVMGDGNDVFHDNEQTGYAGRDFIYAGAGNDTVYGNGGDDVIDGNGGNDLLYGGGQNDLINGQDGNDTIYAGTGNDTARGQSGRDLIDGGAGNDLLLGGLESDTVIGGAGSDTIYGGDQSDQLFGGADNDIIHGGNGNDTVHGNQGNDVLYGDAGNDLLNGHTGNDTFYGGDGRDSAWMGDGDDIFHDSSQTGAAGSDIVSGDAGNDRLHFGGGNDTGYGGTGADTFLFFGSDIGNNLVGDFERRVDRLHLDDALWGGTSLTAAQVVNQFGSVQGGNVVLNFGAAHGSVTLAGLTTLTGLEDDLLIF